LAAEPAEDSEVAVPGHAGKGREEKGREGKKTDCWGTVPHWDGGSDNEMTAVSGGRN
jgi:hypothetical protein